MQKLGILVRCSSELFEDSASDLSAFLTSEFAYAFAAIEDDSGFFGDGSQAYRGIQGLAMRLAGNRSSVTAAAGHNTFSTVDTTDLSNLVSSVLASALPGAAWYCSSAAFGALFCRLGGTSGGLVATAGPGGLENASYLGFPIRFLSKLPDVSTTLAGLPMLFFGDLSMSSLLAERRKLIVSLSRQHALDTDQILIRCTQRMMISNHDTGSATVKAPIAMLLGGA
jgi:HK97 family phage major capsid protein